MSPLWTAAEAASATGGRAAGAWAVADVAIDTRSLPDQALFVALRGDHRDGHEFVPDALRRGASAMVARREHDWPAGASLLEVDDTLAGLEALGRAARARSPARIAGITGSVGKTGTKEALRHVLSLQAPTHGSAASHNNHWGVPLSLARLPRAAAYGVFELGMNHPGEIRHLAGMVRPHVAVITRIAPAHLEMLGSMEAIADAKAEILDGLMPEGTIVLPRDDEQFARLGDHAARAGAQIVTFGEAPSADWRLLDTELGPNRSTATASWRGRRHRFTVGAAGRHWVMNALAVLAAVEALGGDVEQAMAALTGLAPPPGRGARRELAVAGGTALLQDESYNANPASMRAALQVLGSLPGRRVAALGDMLELGSQAPAMHADLAAAIENAKVDLVFTCGPLMAALDEALPPSRRAGHAADAAALAPMVCNALRPGDVLLVKGSLGSRMRLVVDAVAAGRG